MNLQLYARVLWRFRFLLLAGFVLALAVAFLSVAKVDGFPPSDVSLREPREYESTATVLITQSGFPVGRSTLDEVVAVDVGKERTFVPRFADPSRFSLLAVVYSRLATSDTVRSIIERDGPLRGSFIADGGVNQDGDALPLISLRARATSSEAASGLAERAARGLEEYIGEQQAAAGIEPENRVLLGLLNEPTEATIVSGPSKTRTAFIFLAVMVAVVGLVFLLENLRPRIRSVPPVDEARRLKIAGASCRRA